MQIAASIADAHLLVCSETPYDGTIHSLKRTSSTRLLSTKACSSGMVTDASMSRASCRFGARHAPDMMFS